MNDKLTVFRSEETFVGAQRICKALISSDLVPSNFRGDQNMGNALIALELSQRIGASPLAVMQNLHVINGRPSWSSQFIISALNDCGRFSPIRFDLTGEGDERGCVAWAWDLESRKYNPDGKVERLESPRITIGMAKRQGWYARGGSKWPDMPDVMLRYRAAAFFGRFYAPDILNGMGSEEDAQDAGPVATKEKESPVLPPNKGKIIDMPPDTGPDPVPETGQNSPKVPEPAPAPARPMDSPSELARRRRQRSNPQPPPPPAETGQNSWKDPEPAPADGHKEARPAPADAYKEARPAPKRPTLVEEYLPGTQESRDDQMPVPPQKPAAETAPQGGVLTQQAELKARIDERGLDWETVKSAALEADYISSRGAKSPLELTDDEAGFLVRNWRAFERALMAINQGK